MKQSFSGLNKRDANNLSDQYSKYTNKQALDVSHCGLLVGLACFLFANMSQGAL